MLQLLAASGPRPEHADRLNLFGRLVGSWDLEGAGLGTDRRWEEFTGEWHFDWVLEGRGIQDVIIVRSREANAPGRMGSTLRVYDPHIDAWWVTFMGPVDREFGTLLAREGDDGGIVLAGQWALGIEPGQHFEWSFPSVTADAFRWEGRRSLDDGRTWAMAEWMEGRRRR